MARIALIGLPGSGKSTLGPLLGAALNSPFLDLDAVLEESSGWSPRDWVESRDWETFRSAESVVFESLHRQLESEPDVILGCGGGLVESPGNRQILSKWTCLWLDAEDSILVERTRGSERPQHGDLTPEETSGVLRHRRHSWYQQLGGDPVDTSRLNPEEVLAQVLKRLEND